MSRFEHDIERGLTAIADRATPSPDAWAQIQSRIADQDPNQETEIIMLMENTTTRRRWPLLAAAAAVIALAVGAIIAVGTGGNDDTVPAVEPEPAPDEEGVAPDPEPDPGTVEIDPVDNDPVPLPDVLGALEANPYTVDSLGVALTFAAPTPDDGFWRVQVNDPIAVTVGPDDAYAMMSRVGSFYGADESQNPTITGLGSIPADEIDTWIEANGVIVDEATSTTVGGYPAEFRQVRAPAGAGEGGTLCPEEQEPCLTMTSASADLQSIYDGISTALSSELPHLVWIVQLDDFEPLIIWSHSATRDPAEWRAEVTPFIESIEIGEPAPAVRGGTARLPLRVTATATMSGERSLGAEAGDGSTPVQATSTLEGDLSGELVSSGTQSDDQAVEQSVFTGEITGVGTGSLTFETTTTVGAFGEVSIESIIVSGTDDFAGLAGSATTSISDGEATGPFTGTFDLELIVPRSGS